MPWIEPSASLMRVADLLGPQPERLQLVDQVAVHLQEVAGQRLALEQVRHLRLDALVAAGDRGDRRGRRDRDQQRVAQARPRDPRAQRVPARRVARASRPRRRTAARRCAARVSAKAGCAPLLGASSHEADERVEVDLLGDLRATASRASGAVERQAQLEEHVLQAHHARGPPAASAGSRPRRAAIG